MTEAIKTVYPRRGTSIRKCLVWSQNIEPWTHLVWKEELHVALDLIT